MRVAAVVVNFNGGGLETLDCVQSLRELTPPPWRIYVVDNGSTDDSVSRLRRQAPAAVLLALGTNTGYAAACNRGAARALADGASHVWLLNNDTVFDQHALGALLDADARLGQAILAPKIRTRSRQSTDEAQLWFGGSILCPDLKNHHQGLGEPDRGQFDLERAIPWATGCALFCSKATLDRVGPLDERYFLYLEDVDWCLRAARRGVQTWFVPTAVVYHGVSRSVQALGPAEPVYYGWRNYYYLVVRQGSWRQRLGGAADLVSRLAKTALRSACDPRARRDPLYRARSVALIDAALWRMGPAPRRVHPPLKAANR